MDDRVAYPLAGSFASYLLMRFDKDLFRQFYLAEDYGVAAQNLFGISLHELEEDFFQYIGLLDYDEIVYTRIADQLNE